MRCAVDLHIHSCLSPCGDALMTPNNIANMAKLKGLDMIAVADHNTARQLPAVEKAAQRAGLALLPAMELCSREEVHILSYFRTVDAALAFSDEIYAHLPPVKNRPALFGYQTELDEDDEFVREEERLLISALDLSVDELARRIDRAGGLAVPAHINRGANGILQALGFLPPGVKFCALEVARDMPLPEIGMPNIKFLYSSDAHYLENILEREVYLDLESTNSEAFFEQFANHF
jgi:PHP family Zn ribbon phosphoesterase